MTPLDLPQPYLLFLGDETEPGFAKTALGLKDWAPERCVGELHLPGGTVSAGLPEITASPCCPLGEYTSAPRSKLLPAKKAFSPERET